MQSIDLPQKKEITLFSEIGEIVEMVQTLKERGISKKVEIPQVVVVGTQFTGKSIILNTLMRFDILPRYRNQTRLPIEIKLIHLTDQLAKPYVEFEGFKEGEKYFVEQQIREAIQAETYRRVGRKFMADMPVKLSFYSNFVTSMKLVDLPGVREFKFPGDSDGDEYKIAQRYCKDPNSILLHVHSANRTLDTHKNQKLLHMCDPEGIRTFGIITKIDITDRGYYATDLILNKDLPFRLGCVGILAQSSCDLEDNITIASHLANQRKFFNQHKVYNQIRKDLVGTSSIIKKIQFIAKNMIARQLQQQEKQIHKKREYYQEIIGQEDISDNVAQEAKSNIDILKRAQLMIKESHYYEAIVKEIK